MKGGAVMKEQWKKTGFWFLMVLLTLMFWTIPSMFWATAYCLLNFMCYLFSAVIVTFDRKARPYRYYVGAYLFTTLLIEAECFNNFGSVEYGSWDAVGNVIIALFIVPAMLLIAKDKYKKEKKKYEETFQYGGNDHE